MSNKLSADSGETVRRTPRPEQSIDTLRATYRGGQHCNAARRVPGRCRSTSSAAVPERPEARWASMRRSLARPPRTMLLKYVRWMRSVSVARQNSLRRSRKRREVDSTPAASRHRSTFSAKSRTNSGTLRRNAARNMYPCTGPGPRSPVILRTCTPAPGQRRTGVGASSLRVTAAVGDGALSCKATVTVAASSKRTGEAGAAAPASAPAGWTARCARWPARTGRRCACQQLAAGISASC